MLSRGYLRDPQRHHDDPDLQRRAAMFDHPDDQQDQPGEDRDLRYGYTAEDPRRALADRAERAVGACLHGPTLTLAVGALHAPGRWHCSGSPAARFARSPFRARLAHPSGFMFIAKPYFGSSMRLSGNVGSSTCALAAASFSCLISSHSSSR